MVLISEAGSEVADKTEYLYWREPERELSLDERAALLGRFQSVRGTTESLTDPLTSEDMQLQSMPDASPSKWHLAHTSWFFETFILRSLLPGYRPCDPAYHHLFNSYYNALGQPFSRPQRGLLSRPSIEEVFAYRRSVDRAIEQWLTEEDVSTEHANLLVLGMNHEQQHQELLLTDIKHAFSINPILPAYRDDLETEPSAQGPLPPEWLRVPEDNYTVGSDGEGFCFDNEGPAHLRYQQAFRLQPRLITNGEYLEFLQDGGYDEPRLWLSDGWSRVQQQCAQAPLYWKEVEGDWFQFTLAGLQPLDLSAPVSHVNYYEADAFASWAGHRLPTEFEWEIAAWLHCRKGAAGRANMLEAANYQPRTETIREEPRLLGNLWQWTSSAYQPYPGFRASADAVGEYNGKFMCNQMVLRGGSCITPRDHIRISYRNFFYPHQAWQFTGIRLAGDIQ